MTPPHLRTSKLVERIEDLHRLAVTPAYICSEAAKLWLVLAKDINPAQSPTPYHVGRACDITIGEVDVQLKPETVTYDREEGKTKRIRGATGYIVYKILTPRITPTIDKLLALTTKLGIGKKQKHRIRRNRSKTKTTKGSIETPHKPNIYTLPSDTPFINLYANSIQLKLLFPTREI
jgi:hypothetical protein